LQATFSPDDWKQFAKEVQYPHRHEFFYFAKDEATGLADPNRLEPSYAASLKDRKPTHNVTLGYKFSKWVHDAVFTPGTMLNRAGRKVYSKSRDTYQGPRSLRVLEHVSKAAMFRCRDCGDCSLPDIAFLCPESQCAKNQRNGPCGGTRDGKCEVHDYACIWSRAYDRLKYEGTEQAMLDHAPVIQDESLRGTSSWANALLCRDHTGSAPACSHSQDNKERASDANAVTTGERVEVAEQTAVQADRGVDQQLVRPVRSGL
jgi:methylenetetrahydrofolate reductase (NADPH)